MKIILLGPPGSGKDTQADILFDRLHIPIIGAGNILREYAHRDDEIGVQIKRVIDSGNLLSDAFVNKIVEHRLFEADCGRGFVLDGYPRDVAQAEFLGAIQDIDCVLYIAVSDEVLIKRISSRRVCRCGESYNLLSKPPQEENVCDSCGNPLIQRDDDKEDVVKIRIGVYHESTEPLIGFYRSRGLLREIDGEKSIDDVAGQIKSVLGE